MSIADRIASDIADIDAKIQNVKDEARERVDALLAKKTALVKMQVLVTDELENAVVALQRFGFLKEVN